MFVGNRAFRGRWKSSAAALMLTAAAMHAEVTAKNSSLPEWGTTQQETLNIHAYDFDANTSSDLIMDDGNGYRYFGAPAVPYMAAAVRLPSGAEIVSINLSNCIANDGDIIVGLYDNGIGGGGGGGGTMIAGPMVGAAGCGFDTLYPPTPVNYDMNNGHPLYVVIYFAGGQTDGSARFNNFFIRYRRRVSPAPAVATFADVPTNDFGFQFVEALASSQITGGCGGNNYCPDSPVTRRQMAIFLAKALGLSWPE
jgi:S-layer homology domain